MPDIAAVVFTYKSIEHILEDEGTQSWRMHASHIGEFSYVICTRNAHHPHVEGREDHCSAFLIGRVRDVVPSTDPGVIADIAAGTSKPRYLIRMTEAALFSVPMPGFWKWGRWPTHYESLGSLGTDPSVLDFKPLEKLLEEVRESSGVLAPVRSPQLAKIPEPGRGWREAIDATKVQLGAQLGVDVSAIEITIRM